MTRPVARLLPALLLAPALLAAGCVEEAGDLLPGDRARAGAEPFDVEVTGPTSVPVGTAARFEARAPDVPAGSAFWFWDFGDGVEHEGVDMRSVEHAFTEAGRYTVTVTVVDADGRRGAARTTVGANQEFTFEGSVSSTQALGTREYGATFPLREGVRALRITGTLERPAAAFAILEPTSPVVTVRVSAPDGTVLLDERVTLEGASTRFAADAAVERVTASGDAGLEVVAEEGSTHFTLRASTHYG